MKISSFLVLTLFAAYTGAACAVCLAPQPRVCAEFFRSDRVFVGKVTAVKEVPDAGDTIGGWTYRLAVTKMYRGPGSKFIDVFTENSSGRYPLEIGHTYLLFASSHQGRLWIGSCGNSAEITSADEKIRQIEKVIKDMKSVPGGNIRGRVVEAPPAADKGIEGIPVVAHAKGKQYSAVTDQEGWFHIEVPAGTYSITSQSSKWDVAEYDLSYDRADKFVIYRGGCAELQFLATPKQ
jgi:hypothetical protein